MYNYPGQQQLPLQQQQQTGYFGQQQPPQQLQSQPTGYIPQYQPGIAPAQTGFSQLQYGQQQPQQPQQFLQSQPTGYVTQNYGVPQSIPAVPAVPQQFTTAFQHPAAPATASAPATTGSTVKIPNGMFDLNYVICHG